MQEPGSIAQAGAPAEVAGGHSRKARKDVIVFTSDDEFLLSLGPAMDDRYRSRTTDGTGAWADTVRGRSGVALVDAATIANAPEVVRTMEAEFPSFALVVVAPAAARPQWNLALTRGSIAKLLDRENLETNAIAAALTAEPRAPGATSATAAAAGNAGGGSTPRKLPLPMIAAAAAALLVIAGGAWMFLGGDEPLPATGAGESAAPTATPEPPPADAGEQAGSPEVDTRSVPELLSAARVAFAERRYVEPAAGNALALYSRVLAAEPDNAEAVDGVQRIVAIVAGQAQAEIKAGQIDDASRLLDTLRVAAPNDSALTAVEADMAAARPKWLAARAREAISNDQFPAAERLIGELAALGTDKAVVQELKRSIETRRRNDDVSRAVADARAALVPALLLDTSARGPAAQLASLQQMDRRHAQVVAFQRDYQAALTRAGRDATGAGDFAGAERYLAAAARVGSSRELADARAELQAARDAATAREQQRSEIAQRSARPSTPAATAAAAAPLPKMPKAKKRGAPKYPAQAEREGIEGEVVVGFALTPEGRTRDLSIVDSTPPGVFDEAAMDAVRDWRYEQISAADAARLPRTSVRLTFRIGDR